MKLLHMYIYVHRIQVHAHTYVHTPVFATPGAKIKSQIT